MSDLLSIPLFQHTVDFVCLVIQRYSRKGKKASDVAFLFVTLYSTTLNIFAKYLKFVLFFSNQTSVCRKWLSQEKNTDEQIVMRSEKQMSRN